LLRQTVECDGRQVIACLAEGRLAPAWGAVDCRVDEGRSDTSRQYLGCDGFIARLITDAEKRRRRRRVCDKRRRGRQSLRRRGQRAKPLPRAKRGADQSFKEFKLVTFYDQGGEHRLVSVTRRDHHAAGRLMRRDGGRCGFDQATQRLAVIDGGPWIINHVTDRRDMICYPQFLSQNWQIGSGPTESQCKQVPRRVKGRGKRWDADNAEAVMALEAMRQSNLDDAYWNTCAGNLN